MHEIGSERGQSIVLSVSPAIVQGDVPTFDESGIIQALPDHRDEGRVDGGRTGAEYANHRHRLLRARRDRPRCPTAEQRDEPASLHSVTSSAPARTPSRTVRPRALAVFTL